MLLLLSILIRTWICCRNEAPHGNFPTLHIQANHPTVTHVPTEAVLCQHNCALALHLLIHLVSHVGDHTGASRSGVEKLWPWGHSCTLLPAIVTFCWNTAYLLFTYSPWLIHATKVEFNSYERNRKTPKSPNIWPLQKKFVHSYLMTWRWGGSSYLQSLWPCKTDLEMVKWDKKKNLKKKKKKITTKRSVREILLNYHSAWEELTCQPGLTEK